MIARYRLYRACGFGIGYSLWRALRLPARRLLEPPDDGYRASVGPVQGPQDLMILRICWRCGRTVDRVITVCRHCKLWSSTRVAQK